MAAASHDLLRCSLMGGAGISVIIPAYNSEAALMVLIPRLIHVLEDECSTSEVLLVNDGSRDGTWNSILNLSKRFPSVRGINLMRNYGQHNALLCGIRAAVHPIVVTIDDDLQHPPEEIPRLLRTLSAEYDVVYGAPQKEQHGLFRDLASKLTKLTLQKTMGADVASHVSAFRAFRTGLRGAFDGYSGPFVSIDVLLTWGTTRYAVVKVRHEPRTLGASNYTLRKLVIHALNMMTGFSVWPLQVASLVGFTFTVFGFMVLAFVLVRYLIEGGSVPGFPFLASIIAVFSGAQMFALGIIGEYLARMHFRTMDRPPYAVRECTLREAHEDAVACGRVNDHAGE